MSKFEFGVHATNNARNTMRLNKINIDKLWKGAADKEIGSINNFKILIILKENDYTER